MEPYVGFPLPVMVSTGNKHPHWQEYIQNAGVCAADMLIVADPGKL